jgi:hypothetical protein
MTYLFIEKSVIVVPEATLNLSLDGNRLDIRKNQNVINAATAIKKPAYSQYFILTAILITADMII